MPRQNRITYLCMGVILLCLISCMHVLADTQEVAESIRSQSLFFETFDSDNWKSRWKHSADPKYNGRFVTELAKEWTNKGLVIPEKNKYYGLTALLAAPVDPIISSGPDQPLPLVVQYEVKYSAGVTCGGAYLKLLSADPALAPEGLVDSTPYSIMFGPDRCGGPGKVHVIFRHRNPVNGTITEKHLATPPVPETNDHTHIYTLRLFPDHKFEVLIDGAVKSSGSLLEAATLEPSLLPPSHIPDPEDKKPADWVDDSKIPDLEAEKPDDWDDREKIEDEKAVKPRGWHEDEPELINDPAAKRPADWDEEEDGVWEPNQVPNPKCKVGCGPWKRPLIPNPAYKGEWKPPLIDNPAYKGPWVQKVIPNPHFFEEAEPLRTGVAPIGGVALELWTIDSGYVFDNILITRDQKVAEQALKKLWKPKFDAEKKAFDEQVKAREKEEAAKKAEEAKKNKKRKGKKGRGSEQVQQITEAILKMFEPGAVLAPLAGPLSPLLNHLRENPEHTVLIIGLTPLLFLAALLVVRVSSSGGKDSKAAAVVEEEEEAPGDPQEPATAAEGDVKDADGEEVAAAEAEEPASQPEVEGDAAEGADDVAPHENGAAEAAAVAANADKEITADEDEETDQATTGTRRRTRRAA